MGCRATVSARSAPIVKGCPIAALVVDSQQDTPEVTNLTRGIFTHWHQKLRDLLAAVNDISAERAQRLATLAVAAIEGAINLCRAHRNFSSLDDILTEIAPLLDGAPSQPPQQPEHWMRSTSRCETTRHTLAHPAASHDAPS